MFKDAATLDRQRTAASFDKALTRYGESVETWFDGTVGSIDRRLGACDRLLYSARATVGRLSITDARRYLLAAGDLDSDRRALLALRDDLLTGASSRADVVGPPGWRTASDDDDDDDDRPTVPPKDKDFPTTVNEKQKSRIREDGEYGGADEVDTNTGDGSDSEGKQKRSAAGIQPGDTQSGGPLVPGASDVTALPTADYNAQSETGTGVFNPSIPGHGTAPKSMEDVISGPPPESMEDLMGDLRGTPPETGPPISSPSAGGGQFNPEVQLDTSNVTTSTEAQGKADIMRNTEPPNVSRSPGIPSPRADWGPMERGSTAALHQAVTSLPEAGYESRMPYPPANINESLKGPYQNAIDNEQDPFEAIKPHLGGLDRRWVDLESARFVAANTDALDDNHELATRAHEYAAAKTSTFTPARSAAICERFVARVATLGRRAYRPAVVRTAAYQDFDDQAIYLC